MTRPIGRSGQGRRVNERRCASLAVFALALAACTSAATPTSGGATKIDEGIAALQANPRDIEFEAFVANADLRTAFGTRADEILDQLRKTREGAALGLGRSSTRVGARLAAPLAASAETKLGMPWAFTLFFARSLDSLTAGGRGGQDAPKTSTSTEAGSDSTTTTVITQTVEANASGSRVQAAMHWTYRTTTTDKSGAVQLQSTEDRTMIGVIDVCPSAAGIVPASIDSHMQTAGTVAGGPTTTRTTTTSATFSGHVDDRAKLGTVVQETETSSTWSGGGPSGGVKGTLAGSGVMTFEGGDQLERTSAFLEVVQAALLARGPAGVYDEAQKLWRNGRCVVLEAPDYLAETPLAVANQEKTQHDQEVDPGSDTKFTVKARHRFAGGALSQPVEAALASGEKKLEPGRLDALPGGLTYKAPDEPDKNATARLHSTSKRGIGTLVLAFHTVGKHLAITVQGRQTSTLGAGGTSLTYHTTVEIGRAVFHKVDEKTFEATAPSRASLRIEPAPPECGADLALASETGSVYFTAKIEKRGDANAWVVYPDENRGDAKQEFSVCGQGYIQSFQVGSSGFAIGFLIGAAQLEKPTGGIVIPIDGGTVRAQNTTSFGGLMTTIYDATVVATVTKD